MAYSVNRYGSVFRGSPGTMSSQTLRLLASFQKSLSNAFANDVSSVIVREQRGRHDDYAGRGR
jgi:hypothetical protein